MSSIRVLQFICPTGFYGAERWILALSRNLDPALVGCELAVTREPSQEQNELVRRFGGHVAELRVGGRFSPRAIVLLCRLVRERDIDIIHTHGYKSDLIGLVAARLCRVRCVSTPHGFGEVRDMAPLRRAYHYLGLFGLRFFDSVVPLSRDLHREVVEGGVPEGKLHYIANGVELPEGGGASRAAAAAPDDGGDDEGADREARVATIGYVGQMIKRKRVSDLLEVFDRVRGSGRSVRLTLAGDGPDREALERHAASLESRGAIRFAGFVADGPGLMRGFDVFVMTSSQEGIPRALMEAMSLGIAPVAYDIPGVDQLVEHGRTGLLAPFGDREALAERVCELLDDEALRARIGRRASEFIASNFSGARLAADYTAHFAAVLGRGGSGRAP